MTENTAKVILTTFPWRGEWEYPRGFSEEPGRGSLTKAIFRCAPMISTLGPHFPLSNTDWWLTFILSNGEMNMRLQVGNGCVVNYLKWTLNQNWCGYHLEAGQDGLLRFFNYVVSRSGNRISELRSISRNFLFNNNYLVLIFINIVAINFQERRYAFVNSMQREIIQSGRENYAGPSITLFFQQRCPSQNSESER